MYVNTLFMSAVLKINNYFRMNTPSTPEQELEKLKRIYASAVYALQRAVNPASKCSGCKCEVQTAAQCPHCELWLLSDKWVRCGKCQRPRCYACNEIKLTGCPDDCDFRHCQHCSSEHDCPAADRSPYAVAYFPQ